MKSVSGSHIEITAMTKVKHPSFTPILEIGIVLSLTHTHHNKTISICKPRDHWFYGMYILLKSCAPTKLVVSWDSNPVQVFLFHLRGHQVCQRRHVNWKARFWPYNKSTFWGPILEINLILEWSTNAALVMKIYKVSFPTREVIGFIFSKRGMASTILRQK